jgi:dolichol kinase
MISSSQLIYKKIVKKKEYPSNSYIRNEDFTLNHESKRKATHMVILLLVAVYFGLGYLIYDLIDLGIRSVEEINANIWGIPALIFPRSHSTWFIATFGAIGATLLFLIPEVFRLFYPEDFMIKKATILMREGEKHNVSAAIQLSIASSLVLIVIPDIGISMGAITISVIGDACASLFGRRFHKHTISINPEKSYEGALGGMIFGFISGVIILIFSYDIFSTLILALIGALILGAIDIIDIKISDNLLNPLVIGFSLYFFSGILLFIV